MVTPAANDRPTEANMNDDGFRVVRRKRTPHPTIKVIGNRPNSMVRNMTKTVKCSEEGSGCISLRGAEVKHVFSKACEASASMKESSLLVLVGGWNSLRSRGPAETAQAITESVKKMMKKRKDAAIAVVGIFPRPQENHQYEIMRVAANRQIQADLCKLKAQLVRKKEDDLSFLDMDSILTPNMYARVVVHLNAKGDSRLGRCVLSWIKEKGRSSEGEVKELRLDTLI